MRIMTSLSVGAPLGVLDWIVIALSGLAVVALGIWSGRKQTGATDYFTASGSMGSSVVGISLFATLLSTISYLSFPGEMIKNGPVILGGLLGLPIVFLIVGYGLIPVLMRQRVTSAYEILERRLGLSGRLLGSGMFIIARLGWMGLLVFISAEALVTMLGFDDGATMWVILVLGIVAVAYTTIGGLRAVILTDALQVLILFVGAILTIVLISVQLGGPLAWWPSEWPEQWESPVWFTFDLTERLSVVGAMILMGLWWIATAGADQTAMQRYMAVSSAAQGRRLFGVTILSNIAVLGLLALVGLALLGWANRDPALLPAGWTPTENADDLFPHYITHGLPAGVAGLIVAALFAAAMSSLDSGINAVSAVVSRDFIDRFRRGRSEEPGASDERGEDDAAPTDRRNLRRARVLTLVIGCIIVAASTQMVHITGNFLEMTQKISNLFVVPLFCLMFLALFIPWATPFGAVVSTMIGLAVAILIAFSEELPGVPALGFQWIGPVTLIVQIPAGMLLSLLPITRRRQEASS